MCYAVHTCMMMMLNYYELQGCSPSDWLMCAGVVAECVARCSEGIIPHRLVSPAWNTPINSARVASI